MQKTDFLNINALGTTKVSFVAVVIDDRVYSQINVPTYRAFYVM